MPILRTIKKQIGQLVQQDEVEPLDINSLRIYPQMNSSTEGIKQPAAPQKNDHPLFETPVRNAYSHGLEDIYQLEQVDVKSIRKMSSVQPVFKEAPSDKPSVNYKVEREMDLGFLPEGRGAIDSFILDEPVTVLGLSQHVEKLFLKMNILMLSDLMNLDCMALIHTKGMGQGHIDEVKEKLKNYINGRPLVGCRAIDYESWVKSLIPSADRKRAYLLLEKFDLSFLVSLSPPESVEIRRLSDESRSDWIQEAKEMFNTYDRKHFLERRLHEVIEVFLKPWMLKRCGFASLADLKERLERLSTQKGRFAKAYAFFVAVFFDGLCPIESLMEERQGNLMFANSAVLNDYLAVTRIVDTYFYKEGVRYPLSQLVGYIERELSLEWKGCREGFVEKVILTNAALTFSQSRECGLTVSRTRS